MEDFFELAAQVSAGLTEMPLEPCCLELAEPDVGVGLDRLAARGVRDVVVMPLMLFAAGHVRYDIPAAVATAAARHRDLIIRFARHLGCDRRLADLSRRRAAEALDGSTIEDAPTALVLVGRGSNDPRATAEMHRFVARRGPGGATEVHICFAAMAEPRLPETLAQVARRPVQRVVVQPHLLFPGRLADGIEAQVGDVATESRDRQWRTAAVLGPHRLLVLAVLARIAAARGGRGHVERTIAVGSAHANDDPTRDSG